MKYIFLILSIMPLLWACKKNNSDVSPVSSLANNEVKAQTMLDLINAQRAAGCTCGTTKMPPVAALTWNTKLEQAAYNHSLDMKTNNYFSHTSLDGRDPGTRINNAGYSWSTYGENIASGQTTEESVMTSWINSEGHCKNIMSADVKEVGVGRAGNLWTQVYAKPK